MQKMNRLGPNKSTSSSTRHGSGRSHKPETLNGEPLGTENPKPALTTQIEPEVNFLFVVNELSLNPEYARTADRWGNIIPPESWVGYSQESVGQVFRYCSGIVSAEETYTWYRPGLGLPGSIGYWDAYIDESGNAVPSFRALEIYSVFSMFNCGPFLPSIYGSGDVTENESDFDGWRALHFHHMNGISQASANGGYKCVAGRDAGFVNALLSDAYRNHESDAPQSTGLGGQVGVAIGLMALSQQPGAIDAAFSHPKWNLNRWTGRRHDSACKYALTHLG